MANKKKNKKFDNKLQSTIYLTLEEFTEAIGITMDKAKCPDCGKKNCKHTK